MANLKLVPKKKAAKAEAETVIKKAKGTFPAKKASADGKKAPAKKKAAKLIFKAPADFKPAFFEVEFATGKDGLVKGESVSINRVKGRWDNPEAKRFNLAEYDLATQNGIVSRLGAIYAPNILKRLPAGSKFGMILRCNKRSADGSLSVAFKGIKQMVESKKNPGKMKWKWFEDKKDPLYRKLRKIARILPGAFVNVQLPPATGRQKKSKDED